MKQGDGFENSLAMHNTDDQTYLWLPQAITWYGIPRTEKRTETRLLGIHF